MMPGGSLVLNCNKFSNTGTLIARRIELCGLLLRSDMPIPAELMNFLTNKGAIVEQFESGGRKLVKLTGNFTLTRQEVDAFLTQNFNKMPNYYDYIPTVISNLLPKVIQPSPVAAPEDVVKSAPPANSAMKRLSTASNNYRKPLIFLGMWAVILVIYAFIKRKTNDRIRLSRSSRSCPAEKVELSFVESVLPNKEDIVTIKNGLHWCYNSAKTNLSYIAGIKPTQIPDTQKRKVLDQDPEIVPVYSQSVHRTRAPGCHRNFV